MIETILKYYSEEEVLEIIGYHDKSNPELEGLSKKEALLTAVDNENFEYLFICKDIMLDIETTGNKSYACILSIAAVEFNILSGQTGEQFYTKVDLSSCAEEVLNIEAGTFLWWLSQNEKARLEVENQEGSVPLRKALDDFASFMQGKEGHTLWGNSNRIDCGILQNAYNKVGVPIPWDFRKERDIRTLVALAPEIKDNWFFTGDVHNALHDCHNQIGYCPEIWRSLKGGTKRR